MLDIFDYGYRVGKNMELFWEDEIHCWFTLELEYAFFDNLLEWEYATQTS